MNITKNTENQAEGIIKTYATLMRFFNSQKIKNTFWNEIELKDLEQFMEFNGLILSIVPAQAIALAGYLAPKAVSVGVSKDSMNNNAVKNLKSERSKEYIKNIEILSLREFWEKYSKKTEKIKPVLTADLNKILGSDVQVAIFEKVIMKTPSIKYGYCSDKKAVTFFKTTKNISEALSIWIEYSETNSIDYCLGYDSKQKKTAINIEKKITSPMQVSDYNQQTQKQNLVNENVTEISLSKDILKQWGFQDKNLIPDVLNIPSTYKSLFDTMYRIIKIDSGVFKDCINLKAVTIPDTVTEIGDSAFENCITLERINIPNSITKIGGKAFANCKSLDSIIIPNSVSDIGVEAFVGCQKLQQFTLPTRFTVFKDDVNKHMELTSKIQVWNTQLLKSVNIGDYVIMGSYPQTADGQIQSIKWQVLLVENNKMLLISKYGLEARRFDCSSNIWNNSELRQWLNDDFYNNAFADQEKKLINCFDGDNVFLLSKEEAKKYFANNEARKCKVTEYVLKKNNWKDAYYSWWLHFPSRNSDNYIYCVNADGSIRSLYRVNNDIVLVRPALWIEF